MKKTNKFQKRIDLYKSFIKEKKISPLSVPAYEKEIKLLKKIIKLLSEDKMTPRIFDKLNHRYKWDVSKELKNVQWLCDTCGADQGTKPPERTLELVCCSYCDQELTHRTGGGQSDPFYYTFKKK